MINLFNIYQCAARITRHRAASLFPGMVFSMICLNDFGGPGAHFWWFLSILGAWEPVLEAWVTFWAQGSDFCDFWDLPGAKSYLHLGPKMTRNRFKIDPKLNKFFDHFFDRLWSPLGADLVGFWEPKWSQNWSRIGPKSDHEANANIFKFIGRGGVFEDRRCLESIKNRS